MNTQPYVSIDLETTGLNPDTCQVLEIGAVIDDLTTDPDKLPKFRAILKHNLIEGEPYALQMHPKLLFAIAQIPAVDGDIADPELDPMDPVNCMFKPHKVVPRFKGWLKAHGIPVDKGFQPAGKNFANFDKPFLEAGVPNWKRDVKIKYRTIDPGNLFWWPGEEYIPDTKTCYERAGLPPEVAHTAVEDALGVVKLVRAYKIRCIREAQMAKGFIEAFGKLQASLHPSLIVDANNPMGMADDIIRYVQAPVLGGSS